VVGLSLGGGLATAAGATTSPAGTPLFTRQLILNPLLALSNPLADEAVRAAHALPGVRRIKTGWGEGCEKERALGRAGVCQFELEHVAAARDLGAGALAHAHAPGAPERSQLVFDWKDPAVSVGQIQKLYGKWATPAGGKGVCVLPVEGEHSFLSKYDNPEQDKWWLSEMACRLAAFMLAEDLDTSVGVRDLDDHGFLRVAADDDGAPWPYCAMACSNTTCPYNRSRPLSCPFVAPPAGPVLAVAAPVGATAAVVASGGGGVGQQVLDFPCFERCVAKACAGVPVWKRATCWVPCTTDKSCMYTPTRPKKL